MNNFYIFHAKWKNAKEAKIITAPIPYLYGILYF